MKSNTQENLTHRVYHPQLLFSSGFDGKEGNIYFAMQADQEGMSPVAWVPLKKKKIFK